MPLFRKQSGTQKPDLSAMLRNLVKKHVEEGISEALRSEGSVGSEQLRKLRRLARLAEISEGLKLEANRRRWPIAALLAAVTLIIVSVLLVHKPSTEIDLDLKLSSVQFTVNDQQPITNSLSGLSKIDVNGVTQIKAGAKVLDVGRDSASVSSVVSGKRVGKITLAALIPPAGTRVWLSHTSITHEFHVSLESPPDREIELTADADGPTNLESPSFGTVALDFGTPNQITLTAASNHVDLLLSFFRSAEIVALQQIPIKDIYFFQEERFSSSDFGFSKEVSSIVNGIVYLDELNGQPISLRPGESLRFSESRGELRAMSINNEAIQMQFHGYVRGMSTGSVENPRSLMPSWLEWLKSQQAIVLLWGAVLYVFTFTLVIFRWWHGKI